MRYTAYIYLIFLVLLFPNENLDLIDDDIIDHIVLDFEPLGISSYLLDRYYPNHFSDFSEYAYTIDGMFRLPIHQNISGKIYFNLDEDGTFTQLSYKQKKSDLYFDTNIAFKTDLSNTADMIFKAESKSLSENINQNYVLFLNKNYDKSNLKLSYMYHIENLPFHYENIEQDIESFNLGYSYTYTTTNYEIKAASSLQISNNKRNDIIYENEDIDENDIIYDLRTYWNNTMLDFILNEKMNFVIKYIDKKIYLDQESIVTNYMSHSTGYFSYGFNKNFNLAYGLDHLNNKYFPLLYFIYDKNKYRISLIEENNIVNSDIEINVDEISNISFMNINNRRIEVLLKHKNMNNLFSFGNINAETFNYDFYFINGSIEFSQFIFKYDYYFYDSDITYLKKYCNYALTYSPVFENKKYRPYAKLSGYYININELYDLNIENINLFQFNDVNESIETNYNLNLFSVEFGFIFNAFKISFVRKNPMDSEVIITNKMKYIRYDYIDLVWYFKD